MAFRIGTKAFQHLTGALKKGKSSLGILKDLNNKKFKLGSRSTGSVRSFKRDRSSLKNVLAGLVGADVAFRIKKVLNRRRHRQRALNKSRVSHR